MDKKEALEILKQCLEKIPHLKELQYDNREYQLWRDKVEQIVKSVFSPEDLTTLWSTNLLAPTIDFLTPETVRQNYYLKRLDEYGVNIEKIIQKYEILGIGAEPAAKDYEKKAATEELELIVEGNPDMVIECITNFVKTLNSQGYAYKSVPRIGGAPDYAKWDKTCSATCAISQSDEGQIGTIELQLLPKDRTLLKYPKPEDCHASFGYFMDSLFAEFQALGFVESEGKKPAAMAELAPKAFIAHGGDSPALKKLKSFLEALGVQPLVVEEQPSEGRSIAENVDWYARQADCAIILATKGDIDGKTGRFIPRGNVLIEIGKSQELFKDRIIYLLQAGTKFPTNVSEKVRERFTSQNMDNAFIKIAKELKRFGILRAVKL